MPVIRSIGSVVLGNLIFALSAFAFFRLTGQPPHAEAPFCHHERKHPRGCSAAFAGGNVAARLAGSKAVLMALLCRDPGHWRCHLPRQHTRAGAVGVRFRHWFSWLRALPWAAGSVQDLPDPHTGRSCCAASETCGRLHSQSSPLPGPLSSLSGNPKARGKYNAKESVARTGNAPGDVPFRLLCSRRFIIRRCRRKTPRTRRQRPTTSFCGRRSRRPTAIRMP